MPNASIPMDGTPVPIPYLQIFLTASAPHTVASMAPAAPRNEKYQTFSWVFNRAASIMSTRPPMMPTAASVYQSNSLTSDIYYTTPRYTIAIAQIPSTNDAIVHAMMALGILLNLGSWKPSIVPVMLYDARTEFTKNTPIAMKAAVGTLNLLATRARYSIAPPAPARRPPMSALISATVGVPWPSVPLVTYRSCLSPVIGSYLTFAETRGTAMANA